MRRLDPRLELDIAAEVETVGDVVYVLEDLGLRCITLFPFPFLLQFLGEMIGIFQTLDVTARSRISIPVSRPADAIARLEDPYRKSEVA